MATDSIEDQFLVLASGDKRRRGRTPIYQRDPIGAKGIGKLAGLGIAPGAKLEAFIGNPSERARQAMASMHERLQLRERSLWLG